MKINSIFSCITSFEGRGFSVEGEYAEIVKCVKELNLEEYSHISTSPVNARKHTLYFKHDTPDEVFAKVQYALYEYGLKTDKGFLHPAIYGWRKLYRKIGFPVIRDNWCKLLFDFLLGMFLLGNNGYGKKGAFVMLMLYIVFMQAMFFLVGFTDSSFISIPAGIVAIISFSSTVAASIPLVGDVSLDGFADDGVMHFGFSVLFLIVTASVTIFLPVWSFSVLFMGCCLWLGFRSTTRISPRDATY